MKLRVNNDELKPLQGKAFFLDNDFLSLLYSDKDIFMDTLSVIPGDLYIDPFVKFEFLRDVFDPKIRKNKEAFVDSNIFQKMPDHHEIYYQIRDLAIKLSLIYASQKKAVGSSFVDLMLAAQLVKSPEFGLIITGNRKDYPSIIFDLVAVLNTETSEDNVRGISIIKLNFENYSKFSENLKQMNERYNKELLKEIQKIQLN